MFFKFSVSSFFGDNKITPPEPSGPPKRKGIPKDFFAIIMAATKTMKLNRENSSPDVEKDALSPGHPSDVGRQTRRKPEPDREIQSLPMPGIILPGKFIGLSSLGRSDRRAIGKALATVMRDPSLSFTKEAALSGTMVTAKKGSSKAAPADFKGHSDLRPGSGMGLPDASGSREGEPTRNSVAKGQASFALQGSFIKTAAGQPVASQEAKKGHDQAMAQSRLSRKEDTSSLPTTVRTKSDAETAILPGASAALKTTPKGQTQNSPLVRTSQSFEDSLAPEPKMVRSTLPAAHSLLPPKEALSTQEGMKVAGSSSSNSSANQKGMTDLPSSPMAGSQGRSQEPFHPGKSPEWMASFPHVPVKPMPSLRLGFASDVANQTQRNEGSVSPILATLSPKMSLIHPLNRVKVMPTKQLMTNQGMSGPKVTGEPHPSSLAAALSEKNTGFRKQVFETAQANQSETPNPAPGRENFNATAERLSILQSRQPNLQSGKEKVNATAEVTKPMAPADRQEAKAHAPGPLSSQESQRFSEKAPETSGHLLKGQANFTQKKVAAPVLSPSTEEGAAVLRDSKNSSSNPSRFDSFQKADAAETKSGLTKPTQPDQRSGVLRDPDPVAERLSSSESITSSKGSVEPALPQISAQRPGVMAKMDATGLLFSDPGGSARGTLDQVRAFLERQSLTPPRELELQLEPKRLGKIRVQLSLQGDKIQALFRTETPQAMQVLRQGQGELEQSLRQSGHELSHFDVKQDSSPQQQSNQHGQNGQSALQSQGEGQGRHHRSAQGASPVPEQPQEMETDLLPVFREGSEELQREGLNVTA